MIAFVAIAVGVVVLWAASAALTARHNRSTTTGSVGGIVQLGDASRLAAQFQRGGGVPMYFPDVSGNDQRGVYLAHSGARSDRGWTAFRAQVPGEDPSCQWEWNVRTDRFDASCDVSRHVDANGTGLEHYPVSVTKGRLVLDLRGGDTTPQVSGSSTAPPTRP